MARVKLTYRQKNTTLFLLCAMALIWTYFGLATAWSSIQSAETLSDKWSAFLGSTFLSSHNLSNLLRGVSIIGIMAIGMVFVIISGEIDLSVGSLMGLIAGIGVFVSVHYDFDPYAAMGVMMVSGLLIGMFNGWLIAYRGIPSFIVTLGGMLAFRGLLTVILEARTLNFPTRFFSTNIYNNYFGGVYAWVFLGVLFCVALLMIAKTAQNAHKKDLSLTSSEKFSAFKSLGIALIPVFGMMGIVAYLSFGELRPGVPKQGVPFPVLILVFFALIFSWIAKNTLYGRYTYAVGGNLDAARLSGIMVRRQKMLVFMASGFLVSIAAIIAMSRLNSTSPSLGLTNELYTIAACFVGGTSMRGGVGTVFGAMLGAIIMASLQNGMQLLNVSSNWQDIIMGAVLLLAVYVDMASRNGEFARIKSKTKAFLRLS